MDGCAPGGSGKNLWKSEVLFVSVAECYGGPLDTDKAVDSEGILAYIRAVRALHEITGDDRLLQHLRDAIHYECSFKLCYNPPIQVPPLSEIGWSGCGGSITSTANPHVHPMSSTIVDELIYYVKQTNDIYVRMRLEDTVAWGLLAGYSRSQAVKGSKFLPGTCNEESERLHYIRNLEQKIVRDYEQIHKRVSIG